MTASYQFIDNKYTRWYYQLIEQRAIKDRRRKGEVHHIVPRSLGGSDDSFNLVKLNGHDHAWCHWLLTKMTEGDAKSKMVYAFNMMGVYGDHMDRPKSWAIVRAYEKNRAEWSKIHSKTMKGKVPHNKGKKLSGDALEAQRKRIKNRRKPSAETLTSAIAQRVTTMKANGNDKRSDETKALMSAWQAGISKGPQSEEHRLAISRSGVGKKKREGHRTGSQTVGVISINKDGVEKKVKQPQLQSFLDEGWARGGLARKRKVKE